MTRTRPLVALLLAVVAFAALAPDAAAQARRGYRSNKSFGLGVMLGAPSGLTGKVWTGGQVAIDFGIGSYFDRYYEDDLHAHVDVLWHPAVLARTGAFDLPFYVGVGGRVLEHGYYDDRDDYYYGHTHVGLRVPFGVSMDFRRAPIDVFAEIVPVLDLTDDRYYERNRFDLSGAMGIRYYF